MAETILFIHMGMEVVSSDKKGLEYLSRIAELFVPDLSVAIVDVALSSSNDLFCSNLSELMFAQGFEFEVPPALISLLLVDAVLCDGCILIEPTEEEKGAVLSPPIFPVSCIFSSMGLTN